MGGNALSTPSIRLEAPRYHALAKECLGRLAMALPPGTYQVIPALYDKPNFGDMDIVIGHDEKGYNPEHLATVIGGDALTEIVENGWVTSFGLRIDVGQAPFQIDLLRVPPQSFDFALGYFAFNDLGNLLGRVARETGFRLGFRGLEYAIDRLNHSQQLAVLPVTTHWDDALIFLGYDPKAYQAGARGGFKTHEDIFRFAASSPFFHPDIFHPDNAKSRDRTRDAKRPTYNAFLKWLAQHRDELNHFEWAAPDVRKLFLMRAYKQFPDLQGRITHVLTQTALMDKGKQRLNGERVGQLTGREQQDIGELLRQIDAQFGDRQAAQRWAGSVTQEDVDALILDAHNNPGSTLKARRARAWQSE